MFNLMLKLNKLKGKINRQLRINQDCMFHILAFGDNKQTCLTATYKHI